MAKVNNVCPTSPTVADYIGVNSFAYSLKNILTITSGNIDFKSLNIAPRDYLSSVTFNDGGVDYVLLIITTNSFIFGNYC